MGVPTELKRGGRERRGLRLLPVGWVLAAVFAAALVVAGSVFAAGWELLDAQGLKPERRLDSSTLFDLVKLAFGVVAGAGALVALVVAYRRQRIDEDAAVREATRLHTERFSTAVTQLGDSSPVLRLGGVHSLAGLADDAPTRNLRQTCIDVLCAYLRLPHEVDGIPPHEFEAMREVRHTVIRLIRDHLRLSTEDPHCWSGHDFDFTDVVFDCGDFTEAVFRGGRVSFRGANFSVPQFKFDYATFGHSIDFSSTKFNRTAAFIGASFFGRSIQFDKAIFAEEVHFIGANFHRSEVRFKGATFSSSKVDFSHATLRHSELKFPSAQFSRGRFNFCDVIVSGSNVDLRGARGITWDDVLLNSGANRPAGLALPPT